MALLVPASQSTYGDATCLPGGPLSPYILAQLPSDAELGWIPDIRRMATVDEVKWKVFQQRRERIQAKADLWNSILAAIRTTTIVIIRPEEVEKEFRKYLDSEGAEEGHDYDAHGLIHACSSALISDTPVAYLPNKLTESLGLYPPELFLSFDRFVPDAILSRIGGGLRDAKVFAARAHAMFDASYMNPAGSRTTDAFRATAKTLVLQELLATERGFDEEHPRSVDVLNEAASTIALALAEVLPMPGPAGEQLLVKEYSSRDIDQLQAADIAAGWAHELVALGNERALLDTFGRVIVNGRLLR